MKRVFVPFLLLFAAAMSCPVSPVVSHPVLPIAKILPAQVKELELKVEGKGIKDVSKVVYEPRIIKYKQVESFPFITKVDPIPKGHYTWTVPPFVWAVPKGNTLEIRQAPKGELIVDLQVETTDAKTGEISYSYGQLSILIGDAPPDPTPPGPTPPGPNPPAPEVLVQTMTAGLYHDGKTPENLDKCKKLAATFRVLASSAKADQSITTNAKMFELLVGSVRNTIAKTDLVQTYDAIGNYLNSKLPTTVDTPINRDLWSSELTNVANALEGLK